MLPGPKITFPPDFKALFQNIWAHTKKNPNATTTSWNSREIATYFSFLLMAMYLWFGLEFPGKKIQRESDMHMQYLIRTTKLWGKIRVVVSEQGGATSPSFSPIHTPSPAPGAGTAGNPAPVAPFPQGSGFALSSSPVHCSMLHITQGTLINIAGRS